MNESTTKLASSFLTMACINGAIYPSLMDLISVKTKRLILAYILPGGAYIIVAIFAYWNTTKKRNKPYVWLILMNVLENIFRQITKNSEVLLIICDRLLYIVKC